MQPVNGRSPGFTTNSELAMDPHRLGSTVDVDVDGAPPHELVELVGSEWSGDGGVDLDRRDLLDLLAGLDVVGGVSRRTALGAAWSGEGELASEPSVDDVRASSGPIDPLVELRAAFGGAVDVRSMPTDPLLFLLSLSSAIAGAERGDATTAADENALAQRSATDSAARAHRRAAAANRRASRFLARAPKWVKKLFTAIVAAVGVAAAAFTGGASLGLAIAGAVLLLGAEGFQKLAVKLGVDPDKAKWIGLACQVAGAVMMAGAGAAGGAGSAASATATASTTTGAASGGAAATAATSTATSVASATGAATNTANQLSNVIEQAQRMIRLVQSLLTATDGTRAAGGAVLTHRADDATTLAERQELQGERVHESTEEILDAMRRSIASFRDVETRTLAMLDANRQLDDATMARIGR